MEPKWQQVRRQLEDQLGEAGEPLPSESELMKVYSVSRNTVRQALRALEASGLITSGQGSRRVVRGGRRWHWDMSIWERAHSNDGDAWANTIRSQGGTPYNDIQIVTEVVPAEIAPILDIPEGTVIQARHRIRSVNGVAHQLSDSFFPPWVTEHELWHQPGDVGVQGGLLAATGHAQKRWHDTITARMPTSQETERLRLGPGTPLLVHARTGYDDQDRPVRHMITRVAADHVEVSYDLEA